MLQFARTYWLLAGLSFVGAIGGPRAHAVNIYVVPAEGGKTRVIFRGADREIGSPDWSPDGKRIACDTWLAQGETFHDSQVALVPAAGGEMQLLGPGAMPSWSPDGSQLVCHTYRPNQIVVLNADGSGREAILDQWGSPRWSPDGRSIFTVRSQGGLARFDLATGKQTAEVAPHTSITQGFGISPDGKRFCYAPGGRGIEIAEYDEQFKRWKTTAYLPQFECSHSSWSPDGRRVVFHAAPGGDHGWRLMILDTRKQRDGAVTELKLKPPLPYCASPDWSPDGKSIVFVGVDPE